jgi:hypothetical protein
MTCLSQLVYVPKVPGSIIDPEPAILIKTVCGFPRFRWMLKLRYTSVLILNKQLSSNSSVLKADIITSASLNKQRNQRRLKSKVLVCYDHAIVPHNNLPRQPASNPLRIKCAGSNNITAGFSNLLYFRLLCENVSITNTKLWHCFPRWFVWVRNFVTLREELKSRVRFQVFTVLNIKRAVLWDVKPCRFGSKV